MNMVGPMALTQSPETLREIGVDIDRQCCAGKGPHRVARSIGGQFEQRRGAGQSLPPIIDLALQRSPLSHWRCHAA